MELQKIEKEFDFEKLVSNFTFSEVYDAFISCKSGKKSYNVLKFEYELEKNLCSLLTDLNSNCYEISRAICFVVTKPKIREIWASDFRDRIVHHLITKKIEVFYENSAFCYSFLDSSFANRKEKGTHRAVEKLKEYSKTNKYYLKLDIESFFNSIDRQKLFEILLNDMKSEFFPPKNEVLALFKKIIFHNYTSNYKKKSTRDLFEKVPFSKSLFSSEFKGKGLPIGNLTSQFLSNVYLNKLDYFIQQELKFSNYIRYVDDFVILSDNKEELKDSIEKINDFLQRELSLILHPKKIILSQVTNGIDFLGYYVKPKYCLARKNVVENLKEKIYFSQINRRKLKLKELEKLQNQVNSYFGHLKHSNSYNLKFKMVKKLDEYFTLEKSGKNSHALIFKEKLNFETVFQQFSYFKHKYNNHLIVFQMGNFYRFFDEQALYVSDKLGLKTQVKKYSNKKHVLCGFPVGSKKYLPLLEDMGKNYVIIIQLKHDLKSGLKERKEQQVISHKSPLSLPGGFQLENKSNLSLTDLKTQNIETLLNNQIEDLVKFKKTILTLLKEK